MSKSGTVSRVQAVALLALPLMLSPAPAQESEVDGSPSAGSNGAVTPAETADPAVSRAERIARLQRTIDEASVEVEKLRALLNDPESEYVKAEAEFTALDGEWVAKREELEAATPGADAANSLQRDWESLQSRRGLAKDRFDLAIQERTTLQEQISVLERRIAQDREAFRKLRGEEPHAATSQPTSNGSSAAAPAPNTEVTAVPALPPGAQTPAPAPSSAMPAPPAPLPQAGGTPAEKPREELVRAREQASRKQSDAEAAEDEARSLRARMDALSKSVELERSMLETARQRARNARETERTLYEELQSEWQAGAAHADLSALRERIAETRTRLRETEREIRERTDRIDQFQSDFTALQNDHIVALESAEKKQREASSAQKRVQWLESPLAPHNVWNWAVRRGPSVLGIVIAMMVLLRLTRFAERRFIRKLTARADVGDFQDRDNRARTLVGVFHSTVSVVIYAGGTLMILTEAGVNIVPLMGGAAVAGLAVAFGAQNLIRDYFYGFTILLENQYVLNDVIKVGEISGAVERITMRVTVLRGLDGTVHYIPNGQINTVSNLTQGWSRVVLDVPVAYGEDVDRVMDLLMDVGRELRRDPAFRSLILETPEMAGVDQLADSAVVIRLLLKTRPMKQWTVKREMLRRVKKRFDEAGIEIPFPQRTVYHRYEDSANSRDRPGRAPAQAPWPE